jgi:type IV pilus assembly protein PilE
VQGKLQWLEKTPKGDAVEKRQRGFSLIELMIAVVIISIMLAIALPNYQQHVISGKRAEAQAFLMDVAQREQQFLLDARRYASTLTELGVTQPSSIAKNYEAPTITVASAPPTFLITLKPTASGTQATDGDLTIDSAGTKSRAAPGGAVSW